MKKLFAVFFVVVSVCALSQSLFANYQISQEAVEKAVATTNGDFKYSQEYIVQLTSCTVKSTEFVQLTSATATRTDFI